jgi:hypothetical protein
VFTEAHGVPPDPLRTTDSAAVQKHNVVLGSGFDLEEELGLIRTISSAQRRLEPRGGRRPKALRTVDQAPVPNRVHRPTGELDPAKSPGLDCQRLGSVLGAGSRRSSTVLATLSTRPFGTADRSSRIPVRGSSPISRQSNSVPRHSPTRHSALPITTSVVPAPSTTTSSLLAQGYVLGRDPSRGQRAREQWARGTEEQGITNSSGSLATNRRPLPESGHGRREDSPLVRTAIIVVEALLFLRVWLHVRLPGHWQPLRDRR